MILHFCHPSKAPPDMPRLHIQARPPQWVRELTSGRYVPDLCPQGDEVGMMQRLVQDRRDGRIMDSAVFSAYHQSYLSRAYGLAARMKGSLENLQDDQQSPITGPVALLCTCSISESGAGRCHRSWAAVVLATVPEVDVWLDGQKLRQA